MDGIDLGCPASPCAGAARRPDPEFYTRSENMYLLVFSSISPYAKFRLSERAERTPLSIGRAPPSSGSLSTQSHTERRERPTPLLRGRLGSRAGRGWVLFLFSPSRLCSVRPCSASFSAQRRGDAVDGRDRPAPGGAWQPKHSPSLLGGQSEFDAERPFRPLPPLRVALCSAPAPVPRAGAR